MPLTGPSLLPAPPKPPLGGPSGPSGGKGGSGPGRSEGLWGADGCRRRGVADEHAACLGFVGPLLRPAAHHVLRHVAEWAPAPLPAADVVRLLRATGLLPDDGAPVVLCWLRTAPEPLTGLAVVRARPGTLPLGALLPPLKTDAPSGEGTWCPRLPLARAPPGIFEEDSAGAPAFVGPLVGGPDVTPRRAAAETMRACVRLFLCAGAAPEVVLLGPGLDLRPAHAREDFAPPLVPSSKAPCLVDEPD